MGKPVDRKSCDEYLKYLVEQYASSIYRIALNRLKNPFDAEDVCQDVFTKAYSSLDSLDDEEHAKAWLFRVTINCCNDLHRSSKRLNPLSGEHKENAIEGALADKAIQRYRDDVNSHDLNLAISLAIESLNEKQRTAIHLFYYEGLSTGEISRITGDRPSTVRSHLRRARKILEIELGDKI